MAHRGVQGYRLWHRVLFTLLFAIGAGIVFSALFIIGDLLLYGRVNW
jgi:hypothetical protein